MTLFKQGKIETAYFKAGIYGLTKTGKTYTATKIAIGLWHYIQKILKDKPKPIYFSDTEAGSDFVLDRFPKELKETGFQVGKTRAFQDLVQMADEAEKNGSIWIVDSITHYWNEMLDAYMGKKNIKRLSLNHWPELKKTWREYSDKYVNSKLHIIMCGRSADLWQDVPDDEGVLELKKVGTRMKAEGEMGYESNLLVEMELHKTGPRIADKYVCRAWINGDKFDRMNFQFFDNPEFKDFLPHISRLNIGGKHRAIDAERTSVDMFQHGDSGYQKARMKDGLLDRVKIEIEAIYPGRATQDIQDRRELARTIFKTPSWDQIKLLDVDKLSIGLADIEKFKKEITVKKNKEEKKK
jgi:hypothetical protein